MAAIDLLVLDVNGVLYRYDPDLRIRTLAATLGVGAHDVRAAIFDSGLEDAADAGEIAPETYLQRAAARMGVPLDPAQWASALSAAVEPDGPVLDAVAAAARQVQVTTLSNNGLLVRELLDRIYPALAALPIEFHVAAEFGESKPDTDVYVDVCQRFDVEPVRAAFVDDKKANVDGAVRAGMVGHHFTGLDGFVTFLAGLGVTTG